jgi:hypothetical protein
MGVTFLSLDVTCHDEDSYNVKFKHRALPPPI